MKQAFELNAKPRTPGKKGVNRRERRLQQVVPGVIYGAGEQPELVSLTHKDLGLMLANEATYSRVLKINMDNKSQQVVLKAVQRHPYKPQILHVDFLRIRANEKITMNVPLHFIGEDRCVGVKEGGLISKLMTEVEIECLPADLPEFIDLDVSGLSLDHSLHLSDIPLPSGVELAIPRLDDEHNLPVVSVRAPRIEKEVPIEEVIGKPEEVQVPEEGKGKEEEAEKE
jgi:large subunit ribosomal protein L25